MRKPSQFLFGIILLVSAATVSRTLAGSISLGAGNLEFGQGVLIVTNCDPTIFAQPIPRSVSGTYYLDGIEFSGIDTVSCDNRDFRIKVFNSSGATDFAANISEMEVRLYGGFFYSLTEGVRLTSGDSKGWFIVTLEGTPTLASGNLQRITLESDKADQFQACDVTPTANGSELTYIFSTVGACLFTSPHTKNGASFAVVGAGGGGGGGSAVSYAIYDSGGGGGGGGGGEVITGTTNLIANGKYLIVVGAGGVGGTGGNSSGGWNGSAGQAGYTSAAFGQRARAGWGGLGGAWNLDSEGVNNSGCSGSWSDGTGGIGGASGNLNAGGTKSCSFAGGASGGGSGGAGSTPTSSTGASGGAGTSGIIATHGAGGNGGNGGATASPANISAATTYGFGGAGGTGAKAGASTAGIGSVGGKGAPGVVILRYTP